MGTILTKVITKISRTQDSLLDCDQYLYQDCFQDSLPKILNKIVTTILVPKILT